MRDIMRNIPEIIEQASKSPLGILALMILALAFLGYFFFRRANVNVRISIYLLLFVGAALCGFALLRARQSVVATSSSGTDGLRRPVVIYSAMDPSFNDEIAKAFRERTGLIAKIDAWVNAVELADKIRSERAAAYADVFLGGSSEIHESLDGMLEEYESKEETAALSAQFTNNKKTWKACWWNVLSFAVNEEELPGKLRNSELGWDSLKDPGLRRKISLPDPTKSGGGFIYLAIQIFRFGKNIDDAREFLEEVHRNEPDYEAFSPTVVHRVGKGEVAIGLAWHDQILRLKKEHGYKISVKTPKDTGSEIGAVSIIKGGPNPTDARKFIDFMLGEKVAEIIAKSYRFPLRQSVRLPPELHQVSPMTVSFVSYNRREASENFSRWIKMWEDIARSH